MGWLDEEGYPKQRSSESQIYDYGWSLDPADLQDNEEFSSIVQFTSISIRWYDILSRFANELHALRTFRLGSSTQWKLDIKGRYVDQGYKWGGLPIMP